MKCLTAAAPLTIRDRDPPPPCCCPIPGDPAFKISQFYSPAIFKAKSISSYGLFTSPSAILCLHPFSLILSTSSVFLSGFFSLRLPIPLPTYLCQRRRSRRAAYGKRPFSNRGKNWRLKNVGRDHLSLRGVRGLADREGRPAGRKERPKETRGQGGRGLRSGAGSPESRDRGEDAASRGREGEAEGRESTSRTRALHEASGRGRKGF